MPRESNERSRFRPRILTIIVLLVVAAPIVVANLSRDQVVPQASPPQNVSQVSLPPTLSYGWPLNWYWCKFKTLPNNAQAPASQGGPDLAHWSGRRLAANIATWVVMLGVAGVGCQWLLRRYGAPLGYRPRLVTLIVVMVVGAPLVLANLSHDDVHFMLGPGPSYGWPFIWRWRNVFHWYGATTDLDQNYSAARLTGNLALWIVMLAAPGVACEWLLRRYPPRLRWSLRTMLAAIGVFAALCAWCVALRDRASVQDPIISVAYNGRPRKYLFLERWGPKWLDLVGADRFRRRVVGAKVDLGHGDEEFFESLVQLPSLRYLRLIASEQPTPGLAAALANMSQLRTLRIEDESYGDDDVFSEECLAAIGKLAQLEELHLGGIYSGSLVELAGLRNLKSLSLQIWDDYEGDPDEEHPDENASDQSKTNDKAPLLGHLPTLPRLEAIDISSWRWRGASMVGDQDLRHLALVPRLKSLNLSGIDVTDAGLGELASLESLEELAIGGDMASAVGLQSLDALKCLKALHIERHVAVTEETAAMLPAQESIRRHARAIAAVKIGETYTDLSTAERSLYTAMQCLERLRIDRFGSYDESDRMTTLPLDHGDRVFALQSEVDGLRKALDALRKSNSGIVIDSDPTWLDQHRGEKREKHSLAIGVF